MHPVADIDLASYANGARIVVRPAEADPGHSSFWLFDGDARTGWATPKGETSAQQLVIVLPGRSRIRELEFDTDQRFQIDYCPQADRRFQADQLRQGGR